ncbi:MAG: DUF3037 domain-containing protein [Acidobacteriia bacterium]|nr:DUF3037 domain-containing protein [Terriglobia bacterium]
MTERKQCEFFLIRYVPDAVKDEFVNIGAVLLNGSGAQVRFTHDWRRVRCLDPAADVEMLEALEGDLRSLLGDPDRERLLKKLQDSFSNAIQLSPTKALLAEDPAAEIERLVQMYLEVKRPAGKGKLSARQAIFARMRDTFVQAGVWKLMRHRIAVAQYTHKGDPLKIDCGYRPNGEVKMFHAVSLATEPETAKILAFSFPQIEAGILKHEQAKASLTAIVEDDLDRGDDAVAFALETLDNAQIAVTNAGELAAIANRVRGDLKV